jgi:DNA-directed RNA polymerase subunit RPC12/RpoP
VFRNQLRKSVPNLLEGFKIFKQQVPNAKLLLHTHWSEGWDIPTLLQEKGINDKDILTTYFCNQCKSYFVSSFVGQERDCPSCGGKKTVSTTNIHNGVSEDQLNEIYNLMDVYCHPFTSGGQEIPVQEAKLTELITLVTDYSCGEEYCTEESGGLPLNWAEYREPGTQFIKASTDPNHIAEQLLTVYNTPSIERAAIGIKARQFVIDECSIEAIGGELESIIDSMPEVNYDFDNPPSRFNVEYQPDFQANEKDFIISLHAEMLGEAVDENHSSFKIWKSKLQQEINREQMHNHFRQVCLQQQQKPIEFESVLDKDDEGRRICVLAQGGESDVLLLNGLMENLHKQYPNYNIYFATRQEYFPLIEDSPFVHKCILYSEMLENSFILEGAGNHKGYFDLAFMPTTTTQKNICYIHNGKDKIQFDLQ